MIRIAAHTQRIQPIVTISGTPLGASLEGFDPMPKQIPEISIRTPAIHPFLDRPANIINITKKLKTNSTMPKKSAIVIRISPFGRKDQVTTHLNISASFHVLLTTK